LAGLLRATFIIFKGGLLLRTTLLPVVVVIVAIAMLRLFSGTRPAAPVVGSPAPDFTLPSQDGASVSLKDYRGSWVVLYFYPKDQTPGCTREAHNFQLDQAKYADRHAIVLGVSVDSAESHKKFCAKEGLNFKLLADTSGKVSKAYGSLTNLGVVKFAARHSFIIDHAGNVAKAYTSVDPARHSEEVLAALDQLRK
jgi:thioredoxin-dependent peroxiredoxin